MQWHLLFPLPKQIHVDSPVMNKSRDQCFLMNLPELLQSGILRCVIPRHPPTKDPHIGLFYQRRVVVCTWLGFWAASQPLLWHCGNQFQSKASGQTHTLAVASGSTRLQIRWGRRMEKGGRVHNAPDMSCSLTPSLAGDLQRNSPDDEPGGK